uniref:Uncharacterized protein n=1 Tax=Anguilla anguilla TaxID=7936 RepID=A0A0E9U6Q0_ANGAN
MLNTQIANYPLPPIARFLFDAPFRTMSSAALLLVKVNSGFPPPLHLSCLPFLC